MERAGEIAKSSKVVDYMTYRNTKSTNPLCPVCFKKGKETITSFMQVYEGNQIALTCQECDAKILEKENKDREINETKKLIKKRESILPFSNLGSKYVNSNFSDFDILRDGLNNCNIWAKRFKNRILLGGDKISLYMYGDTGNGKTELQACAYNELVSQGENCLFTTLGKIFGKMHDYDNVKDFEVYEIIKNLGAFFIDDFGVEELNKKSKEWLFEIFDIIDKYEIPTFITSNFFDPEHFKPKSNNPTAEDIKLQRIFSRMIAKFDIIENKAGDYRPIQAAARMKQRQNEVLTEY